VGALPDGAVAATVIAAVPDCPSLVAVMVTPPAASAVTVPAEETVATAALLVAHVTERPVRTWPALSLVIAASARLWPTVSEALAGETATDATGAGAGADEATVTVSLVVIPSLVALMSAEPAAIPDTVADVPEPETPATDGLLLFQVTAWSITLPAPSSTDAVTVPDAPTLSASACGESSTLTVGVVTAMLEVPVRPPLVAVIVAVPPANAVTSPLEETEATALLDVAQVTVLPLIGVPVESSTSAES